MTLSLPADTKQARRVHQLVGPAQRLQVHHVPSDWVIHSEGKGPDLVSSVESLRRRAIRQGYIVDKGYAVEDWRPITDLTLAGQHIEINIWINGTGKASVPRQQTDDPVVVDN